MTKRLLAAAFALLCAFASPAYAKHHHQHRTPHKVARIHVAESTGCVMTNEGHYVCGGSIQDTGGLSTASRKEMGGNLTTIECSGKTIKVAASAASKFEGFCRAMVSAGYPTKLIGGWRAHGSCRGCDMHPLGLAIDYGQRCRDCMTLAISRMQASAIAHQYGLISGGDWCHGDLGHFEVDVGTNAPACGSSLALLATRQHHRRYALR